MSIGKIKRIPGLMSGGQDQGGPRSDVGCGWGWGLYSKVQCIMVIVTGGFPCEQRDRQTDTSENITFSQLRWRAVKYCVGH